MLTRFDFFSFNQVIKKFRDEELEHHDTGLEHDAELVGIPLLSARAALGPDLEGWGAGKFLFPEK